MNTNLFGQSYVEPMPSDQLPLFHEPVKAESRLPMTATDRKIGRKFKAEDTPMLEVKTVFSEDK